MTTVFYGVVFMLSLMCSAVYVHFWHKHFDANFNMIFTIVPLACLGYFLFGLAKNFVRDYIWGEDQTVSENPADDSAGFSSLYSIRSLSFFP